ncbi:MAG: hypothetical protein NT039_04255, partial [Candidatus Berkelbacteria bacterium]|nr:hypothetical protein [Candidatus Berkelbacteria bacterium]
GEALMFQVPEFTQFLREQYGGQGEEFWKNFYKDTHQEKRKELGAEGPAEIAERMRQFLRVVNRFANYYHRRYPERRLVPWIVSHGECLSSLSQNITGLETGDIHFGYNEAVVITDRQNELEAQIKNQKYGISLR